MRDFADFLWAVASNWVVLMSGIASVAVALWLKAKRRPDIASTSFWAIGIVCLFFAFFLAWRDEHNSKLALMDSRLPKLGGSIEQVAIVQLPEGKTGIILWVTIRNSGAPSTADNYKLQYHSGGSHFDLPLQAAPREVVFGGKKMDTSQGAIYDKTDEQPIPTGGTRRGLVFGQTDLPLGTFDDTTKFVLMFNDITGKTIAVTSGAMIKRGVDSLPDHVPGTPDAN